MVLNNLAAIAAMDFCRLADRSHHDRAFISMDRQRKSCLQRDTFQRRRPQPTEPERAAIIPPRPDRSKLAPFWADVHLSGSCSSQRCEKRLCRAARMALSMRQYLEFTVR
jgi:hypothetical protein